MDGGVPYFTDRLQCTELRRQVGYSLFRDWFSRFTPLTPSPPGWLNPRKRGCQCEIGYKANLNVHRMDQPGGHGTGRSPVLPARTGNPPGWKTRKRGKPRHYQPFGKIQGSILPEWVSGTGFSNRRFSSTFPPPLTPCAAPAPDRRFLHANRKNVHADVIAIPPQIWEVDSRCSTAISGAAAVNTRNRSA